MRADWRNQEFELILIAIAVGLGAAFLVIRFLHQSFIWGFITFIIVFFLIVDRVSAQRKAMEKTYQASLTDSVQVVQNILDEKGIPYRKSGSERFLLNKDGVEITLKHMQRRFGGDPYTILRLIPHNADSWPLIFSLREKLDDAFRPRGLEH